MSGYARFGLEYNSEGDATGDDTNVAARFRLNMDASTQTDGGLTLGARVRLQGEENSTAGLNAPRFYMSTGGLTLAFGNIVGVIEAAPGLYMNTKSAGVGLEGNGVESVAAKFNSLGMIGEDRTKGYEYQWTAYSSSGAGATDGIEAMYNIGDLGLHAHIRDDRWAIGANYTMNNVTAAIAYEEDTGSSVTNIAGIPGATVSSDGSSILFASLGAVFGQTDVTLAYAKLDVNAQVTSGTPAATVNYDVGGADKWSLKVGHKLSQATYVYGFYANETTDGIMGTLTRDANNGEDVGNAFGIGVSHDLGGGASIEAGATRNPYDETVVSAGVFFAF